MFPTALTWQCIDITTREVDAIVNVAETRFTTDGGVCDAIRHGAGPQLARAHAELRGCPLYEGGPHIEVSTSGRGAFLRMTAALALMVRERAR
jgi:O-acetyl-ADP-ribose deacetylase (regulator of RNase III)